MALHIKSNKSFKILIGFSALCISLMAATFSITGISALFSGSHLTVAFMMGVLEFGKIVVASFLARFWEDLSKVFKTYFSISIIILVLITSAGIFGYLSDAYQKTKGNYDVISNDIQLYDKKIKLFSDERDRLTIQLKNQDNRLNTLYSDQNSLNRRIDNRIKNTESTYSTINKKLSATNDSISFYETSKVQKESLVSTGELGPLKYMSNIFNADMDTIVKYFIFMLIFVFDPLAVLLFISLNVIIKKEELERGSLKDQEYQLKVKELEKQLDDQRKLADEMKRKAEQGSMQMQGEVQELLLEELLKSSFPFDEIVEVGKGVRGADCIQVVRNNLGQEAGKIIYESKRTTAFAQEWIEKLKADMRSQGADIAIIVTQAFPKDMERFGEKEGVYICSYQEVKSVALLLRTALLKIYDTKKNQLNKGDKMSFLYDYLTSNEFNEQWKAIGEGFRQMRQSIQKERDAMEKLWKSREKQLEKVLLNAMHIKGSIEGIAGADSINMNLLEDDEPMSLED